MKVLVADDDPLYRSLLNGMLRRLHLEPILAQDGLQAWGILCAPDPPSIVVLDWKMPGMDGFELCQQIRSRDNSEPYILVMTCRSSRQDLLRLLVAGADDYIVKPFEPLDLQIRLRAAVRIASGAEHEVRLDPPQPQYPLRAPHA